MINPQPEPRVSSKDFKSAWHIIVDVRNTAPRRPDDITTNAILRALISHGWGPQPTVIMKQISKYRSFGIFQEYLESKGIKVIDHE